MNPIPFRLATACLVLCLTAGCQQVEPAKSRTDAQGNTVTDWPVPSGPGAMAPDLALAPDGRLLLSWIKPLDKSRHAFQFTTFDTRGQWQWAPKTIAVGASMVVNWADTPHVAETADGAIWAHWLQKTRGANTGDGGDGESYDIIAVHSTDDGMKWSDPIRVHDDGKPVEHGFVSFWPAARDRIGIAWLDGRYTMQGTDLAVRAGKPANSGMTSLRSASLDAKPSVLDAVEVDDSVCDCCGTDIAMTSRGPLLVYRNRTPDEIRDIYATRLDGGAWRTPQPVHADNWKMTACPVNGPAVAAEGARAVVAWYSAPGDQPQLQIASSADAGETFARAIVVDKGNAVQGRTDVAMDGSQAWVAWIREDAGGQSLWIARYAPDLSRELARIEVAKLQGRGRATGFPKLAARNGEAFVVWTDLIGNAPQLRGARIRAPK